MANVTAIFNKGSKLKSYDYRPVSLNSIPCKILERIIADLLYHKKKHIEFEVIYDLDRFNVEVICIKIKIKNKDVYFITYYNPPSEKINKEL